MPTFQSGEAKELQRYPFSPISAGPLTHMNLVKGTTIVKRDSHGVITIPVKQKAIRQYCVSIA